MLIWKFFSELNKNLICEPSWYIGMFYGLGIPRLLFYSPKRMIPNVPYNMLTWQECMKQWGYCTRLSVLYEMCHGFLDRKCEHYLIPNRERRTQGSHERKWSFPNLFYRSGPHLPLPEMDKMKCMLIPVRITCMTLHLWQPVVSQLCI